MNLGNALMKQKLLCEATAAYQRAVKVDPQNADALNNLAHAYLQRGANLDEAAELCQRAVALNPAHRAYYLDTLGDIRLKQKDPHRALDAFVAALAAATDRESSLRDSLQQKIVSVRHFLGEQPLLKK
jgi:tetratricopeptide (TPR) repeat protein